MLFIITKVRNKVHRWISVTLGQETEMIRPHFFISYTFVLFDSVMYMYYFHNSEGVKIKRTNSSLTWKYAQTIAIQITLLFVFIYIIEIFTLNRCWSIDIKPRVKKFLPRVPTAFKIKKNVSSIEQREKVVMNTHLPLFYSSKTPVLKQGTYCLRILTVFPSLPSSQVGHVAKFWPIEWEHRCCMCNLWSCL